MLKKIFTTQIIFCAALSLILFATPKNSFAIYDNVRDGAYWDEGDKHCDAGNLQYDPLSDNNDVNWEMQNPTCISFITGFGARMAIAGLYAKYSACVPTNYVGVAKAAAEQAGDPIPDLPTVTPMTGYKLLYRSSVLCASRVSESAVISSNAATACSNVATQAMCPFWTTQAGLAAADQARCCQATATYAVVVGMALAALAIIHETASNSFENASICGEDWNVWKKFDVNGDQVASNDDGQWRQGPYDGSYQKCIESIFLRNSNACSLPDVDGVPYNQIGMSNKYYREYVYGGREYPDRGSGACEIPSSWSAEKRMRVLGYNDNTQRYYTRGAGNATNYACQRFLATGSSFTSDTQLAFECCEQRAENAICIENDSGLAFFEREHKFCNFGTKCRVSGVDFEVYQSQYKSDMFCAKTFNVCPYNHLLGGGTEVAKYQLNPRGMPTNRVENYCQVRKHCAKVPVLPFIRLSNLNNAIVSSACRNLKGDSQNVYSFESELLPMGKVTSFSAPIAQCFKETMQNLLLNRAGHTQCRDPEEAPNERGTCVSGYTYIEGQELNSQSAFAFVQEKMRFIVKLVLTLSITFMGAMILLGGKAIEKKQILPYILKIGIIMYFALGTGWQDLLIDGVLETSTTVGDIVMRIDDENTPQNRLDGCQFPRFNSDLLPDDPNRFNNPHYPTGLEYLKIWDTLDCKLMRALGFGPDVSVPNLILAMVGGLFVGGLGIIFVVAAFCFAFFFLAMILRALHIFLLSTIALILMIYVSPIVFVTMLFQKTKSIFDGWLKQCIGYIFQPVILFAYVGIFISIFQVTVVGNLEYRGDGRQAPKQIICDAQTNNTSMYCIFKIATFKTFTGLEPIGVSIPILTSMNRDKLSAVIKAALLMFVFSHFMDMISKLATKLVGGAELKSGTPTAADIAGAVGGVADGIRKRGTRAMNRASSAAMRGGMERLKASTRKSGDLGKSVKTGGGKSELPEAKSEAKDSRGGAGGTPLGGAANTQKDDEKKSQNEAVSSENPPPPEGAANAGGEPAGGAGDSGATPPKPPEEPKS